MVDVAIAGGGIIGLASALELRRRGATVSVFDSGEKGQASWAAAGILGPQSEAHEPSPSLALGRASFALYPEFVHGLGDVGFRRNGTLHRAFSEAERASLQATVDWQRAQGLNVEEREGAFFFPDEGQVDNRKLVAALRAACEASGVEFRNALARVTVVCKGAWSGAPVFPVKGEMLAVDATPPAQVVFGGGGYVVPRGGITLVGATGEPGVFDPSPTEKGRAHLLEVARKHGISGRVLDHWAGLRPGTPDGLPLFGREGSVIVAAGHYRNGILLAPITAKIVSALFHGETPPLDLAPFSPKRYSATTPGRPA